MLNREGKWYWSHSLASVDMDFGWFQDEPNNRLGIEHCGELRGDGDDAQVETYNYAPLNNFLFVNIEGICTSYTNESSSDSIKLWGDQDSRYHQP